MPAFETICKGLNEAQYKAFEQARTQSGLTRNQAIDEALRLFCAGQSIEWPATNQHGGTRPHPKKKRGSSK